MPQSQFGSYTEMIASMPYVELVNSLERLTSIGVIGAGLPATMLAAALLVDRARIARSGITASELRRVLGEYRKHPGAVYGIVKALEAAVETRLTEDGAP